MPQKSVATVIFKTKEAAQKAVAEFNNRELDGQPMVVIIKEETSTARVRNPKRPATIVASKPISASGELPTKRRRRN